jgi:DNA (cytosine-5)-methyltransferase 1
MGLQDSYVLPRNYNEAYHLTGDGVVVDVVRHLARHIFEPIVSPSVVEMPAALREVA